MLKQQGLIDLWNAWGVDEFFYAADAATGQSITSVRAPFCFLTEKSAKQLFSDIQKNNASSEEKNTSPAPKPTDITKEPALNNHVTTHAEKSLHPSSNAGSEKKGLKTACPNKTLQNRLTKISCLKDLYACIENDQTCALRETALKTVLFDGNPKASVMLVGEGPGAEEDAQGKPFVGRSGKLLDKILKAIHLDRTSVYITNVVSWRPPGNRVPTPLEVAQCLPYLEKHIALIKPKVLVLLGTTAVRSVLKTKETITSVRGKVYSYTNAYMDAPVQAVATFHPAYLLRSPGQKKLAWEDFQNIQKLGGPYVES